MARKTSEIAADERLQFGKEKTYRVPRTGKRDFQFVGRLIGYGIMTVEITKHLESYIFQTRAGKYIAARTETWFPDAGQKHAAELCESPDSVAQFFFTTPEAPAPKRGRPTELAEPFLPTDGKHALEKAAEYMPEFRALFIEDIE